MSRAELYNSYQNFVNATCNQALSFKERLGNVATGLAGEAAEVLELTNDPERNEECPDFQKEVRKELGDIAWYLALGFSCLEENMGHHVLMLTPADRADTAKLSIGAGRAADVVKKHLYQAHTLNTEKLSEALLEVLIQLEATCRAAESSLDAVIEMNMEKLRKRYPDGVFNVAQSVNRTE